MKKIVMAAVAVIGSLHMQTAVAAPESPFFVGVALGDTGLGIRGRSHIEGQPTVPNTLDFESDDSQTFSILVNGGFLFTDHIGIEAVVLSSLMNDRVFSSVKVNNEPLSEFHSDTTAMGLYGVFKAGGDFYAKGRFGFAKSQANFEADFASESFSTTGLSFGAAIGQKLGSIGSVELSYMRYPDIKVDKDQFNQSFKSSPAYNSGVSISRTLSFQSITIGYVFEF